MNVFLEDMIVHWILEYVLTLKVHMAANACLVMMAMEGSVIISTNVRYLQHKTATFLRSVNARVNMKVLSIGGYHIRLYHLGFG